MMGTKKKVLADRSNKAWSGRFSDPTFRDVETFTESISVDKRLYTHDIMGSIAHCRMLARQRILTVKEARQIEQALREIEKEIREGRLTLSVQFEDIHMNIEHRLMEKLGKTGGKLHTARSRNDQVSLDTRLYLIEELGRIRESLTGILEVILDRAIESLDILVPGYTHLQRAQPVRLAHHLLAYFEMFLRDRERLVQLLERVSVMPLGAGALAGTSFSIDPSYVATNLRFSRVFANSMDAVSDRDFVIECSFVASLIMMHLSRWAEELIIWATEEFGFVELPDSYCTGSSMMPQKKNPDVLELIRGKTARVYGDVMALLSLMKALPLTYNRDMQEDKEPLFHAVDTARDSLEIFQMIIRAVRFHSDRMRESIERGFLNATDLADYLVRKGVPFRDAHGIAGKAVAACLDKGKRLEELSMDEWRKLSSKIGPDITTVLQPETLIDARTSPGGTSRKNILREIQRARVRLRTGRPPGSRDSKKA